jgi:uncharacterized protein
MICRLLVPLTICLLLSGCQTPPARHVDMIPAAGFSTPAAIDTAIMEAVRRSDCQALAPILAKAHGADLRSRLATPLLQAAHRGSISCVRQLVSAGADVNTSLTDGSTALLLAARQGQVEVIDYLLSTGANVNQANRAGVAPLAAAAGADQRAALARLIAAGADLNQTSVRGWSALHNAIGSCHVQSAEQLLTAGANVEAQDGYGATALTIAAAICEPAVANLLDHGAEIDHSEIQGMTPLMVAAQNGKTQTVAQLLARGADSARKDRQGRDYRDWAATAQALTD